MIGRSLLDWMSLIITYSVSFKLRSCQMSNHYYFLSSSSWAKSFGAERYLQHIKPKANQIKAARKQQTKTNQNSRVMNEE